MTTVLLLSVKRCFSGYFFSRIFVSLAAKIFVPRLLFLIFDPKGKTGSALVCVTSLSQEHTDLQIFSFLDTPTSLGLGPVSATKSFIVSVLKVFLKVWSLSQFVKLSKNFFRSASSSFWRLFDDENLRCPQEEE